MEKVPKNILDLKPKIVNYINSYIDNTDLSVKIENEIFNKILKKFSVNEITLKTNIFKELYKYDLSTFIKNHKFLCDKINNKEFTVFEIFNESPFKIFKDNWKESEKRKKEEEKFLYETNLKPNSVEVCLACKQKNVYVYSKQIRSSDEPRTMFYTCLTSKCKKKWKR